MPESLPEISCENCVAACCKAPVTMLLTADEHKRHSPTMDLKLIVKPRSYPQRIAYESPSAGHIDVPRGLGVFELVSGCANLNEHNRCTIYANRPQCCHDFTVGSSACRQARRKAGLDADRPLVDDEEEGAEPDANERLMSEFFLAPLEGENPTSSTATSDIATRDIATNPLDLAEVRALYARETTWIAERLAECDGVSWTRRTRCAEWTVGALAAHLVTGQRLAHAVLAAAIARRPAQVPADFEGSRAETVEAFARAAAEVGDELARIAPGDAEREVVIGGEEGVTAQHLIQVLTMELAVHGLDLADALGQTRHLTPESMRAIATVLPDYLDPGVAPPARTGYVLRSAAFELPFTWRSNAWRREAAPDPCIIEGEPEAVLLFALGRTPFGKSQLVTNRPNSARAFKRHLTGP